jgi:hypothetical protein
MQDFEFPAGLTFESTESHVRIPQIRRFESTTPSPRLDVGAHLRARSGRDASRDEPFRLLLLG